MALDGFDLSDEANHRRFSEQYVLPAFDGRMVSYNQWRRDVTRLDKLLGNEWGVVWPDQHATFGEPHVPNVPLIAADDRARLVAAGSPSVVCRPEDTTDRAKTHAERKERVLGGYWELNHVRRKIAQWGHDLMITGLGAVKVLPDLSAPISERFPVYTRLDPRECLPGPMFSEGPEPDDCIVAYKLPWRVVAKRFDKETDLRMLLGKTQAQNARTQVEVIEYYDDQVMCAVVRYRKRPDLPNATADWAWLIEPTKHGLKYCPVAISARPNPLGLYVGDFSSILGALRTWNRMVAMSEDAAIDRTYPIIKRTTGTDVENLGPGGEIIVDDNQAVAEWMAPPGEPFSNYQLVKSIADGVRAGALLPLARTGDPNESIISAAGISAANSQMADHVRSLQRDCVAPMLEQANSVALNVDEAWCDTEKSIYGYARGRAYREQYTPSSIIKGNYRNSVTYGLGAGLDEVNTNVLVLQQNGAGLISKRTARERSPFVEDPQREEQLVDVEDLTAALKAGVLAEAAQGLMPAATVAAIIADREKPDVSLQEAVARNRIAAPMAPPEQAGPMPIAAGNAGAEQPTGFQGPPLEQLLGAPRPRRRSR